MPGRSDARASSSPGPVPMMRSARLETDRLLDDRAIAQDAERNAAANSVGIEQAMEPVDRGERHAVEIDHEITRDQAGRRRRTAGLDRGDAHARVDLARQSVRDPARQMDGLRGDPKRARRTRP